MIGHNSGTGQRSLKFVHRPHPQCTTWPQDYLLIPFLASSQRVDMPPCAAMDGINDIDYQRNPWHDARE